MVARLWRGAPTPLLPDRVERAISEQEDKTERLISWIQLAIVCTFGLLYLLSPKTASPDAPFQPVPWVLSIYLVLTVIRIIWSYTRRLPDWSLTISIFFDVGVLLVLIWSFHLQYDQPASFSLKAPTMLYIFIFIAIRALRFDYRFVLLTGLVAAAGWGLLLVYVIYSNPQDMMITRDYITYLTSNSVLLGAEFDKMISILVVSGVLAVALWRGRQLLIRSVSEGIAAQELSRFFAPEVAAQIKQSKQAIAAGNAVTRQAAVLNLDMRGFTRLAGSESPEVVMRILGEYQARMIPVIQRHGGSIDKFLGDGIMASFGAAKPSETYAADGVAALADCLAEARRWEENCAAEGRACPSVNGALATGPVLFGAVGDSSRLEITVIGDAVNLSAKLEKANKDFGSRGVTTADAYELALEQGYRPRLDWPQVEHGSVGGVDRAVALRRLD